LAGLLLLLLLLASARLLLLLRDPLLPDPIIRKSAMVSG